MSRCASSGADSSCAGVVQTQTVPYLIDNPEVGYVQTRWVFVNPDESYLTKVGCYVVYPKPHVLMDTQVLATL